MKAVRAALVLAAAAPLAASAQGAFPEDVSPFERALDALPPMPRADPALEAGVAEVEVAARANPPKTTITVTKQHKDGTTTTATIVKHNQDSEGSEEDEGDGGDEASGDEGDGSSGDGDGAGDGDDGESGGGEDEGSAEEASAGEGRKHVVTTTTTTVSRKVVPLPGAADDAAGGEASAPAEGDAKKEEEKAEESEAQKEAKKEAREERDAKRKERRAESEAESSEESSEESSGEEEPAELRERRARLKALEAKLAEKQKTYEGEHEWLAKAMGLIHTLSGKTANVRLHLNDMHKEMVGVNVQRKALVSQVHELENQISTQRRIKRLSDEMERMVKHAADAKAQMDQLAARRENFASRVAEVRGTLAELKQQAISHRAQANPLSFVAPGGGCNCHMPPQHRTCACE